jgi:cytochrome c peroxidase
MITRIITTFIIFPLMAFSSTAHKTSAPDLTPSPPLGLPPIIWPADNPYTPEKVALGRLLYFDKRLSSDGTIACASCHNITRAFTDRSSYSSGVHGRTGGRHSPTVINTAYNYYQFWDGRARSLEEQALGPLANPNEMTDNQSKQIAYEQCLHRIRSVAGYRPLFYAAFGHEKAELKDVVQAIATFERTIVSGNSPYDRYLAGESMALTPQQKRGLDLFQRVGCVGCHGGPLFTNGSFANIGIGMDVEKPDLGRYEITHNPDDWGAFKVPTLREIKHTYPYMHDGSLKTLAEVIDYYDAGGIPNPNLSPLMKPLHLSHQEKEDLIAFLEALSGEGWQHFNAPPQLPN